jgi:hypothetical protein
VSPRPRRSASRIQSASGVPGRTPDCNGRGKAGRSTASTFHVTQMPQSRGPTGEGMTKRGQYAILLPEEPPGTAKETRAGERRGISDLGGASEEPAKATSSAIVSRAWGMKGLRGATLLVGPRRRDSTGTHEYLAVSKTDGKATRAGSSSAAD